MQTSLPLKTAIIGCGNIAGGYDVGAPSNQCMTHARAYTTNPRCQLVGAYDPDPKQGLSFSKQWSVKTDFDSPGAMLTATKPQIISICSPNETHYANMKLAVEAKPLGIICEKPLSLSLDESREISSLCKESRITLAVNYLRRWDKTLQTLGARIREGEFGAIRSGRVLYTKGVFHNASHGINLLLAWLGPLQFGQILKVVKKGQDPVADFSLRSGDTSLFFHAALAEDYNVFEIELFFSKARILLPGGGREIQITKTAPSKFINGENVLAATPEVIPGTLNRAMFEVIDHTVDVVLKKAKPNVTDQEILDTISLCDEIRRHANE